MDVLYYKIIQESIILSFISKFDARPFNSLASFVTYTIGLRCDEMLNSSPGHCIYHRKFLRCIALFILLVIMIFILLRDHFDIQTLICVYEEKMLTCGINRRKKYVFEYCIFRLWYIYIYFGFKQFS